MTKVLTKSTVKSTVGKSTVKKANTNASNEIYKCDECPRKFFKKPRYEAHKRKHMGLKQWQCDLCEKAFEKSFTLQWHIKSKHFDQTEGKPEFICGINDCGKTYAVKVSEYFCFFLDYYTIFTRFSLLIVRFC